MKTKAKIKIYFWTLIIIGFIAGFLIIPAVHEIGHYSVACAYNCSAIKGFAYSPLTAIQNPFAVNTTAYHVAYTDSVKSIYGDYGILVYIGGFIFEMLLFAAIILLLRKYSADTSRNITIFLLLLGIYANFINSSVSWMSDFNAILIIYFNLDLSGRYAVMIPLFAAIYGLWFVLLLRFGKKLVKIGKGLQDVFA